MGAILETKDDLLGLEERRESFIIVDIQRKYPHELPQRTKAYSLGKTLKTGAYPSYTYQVKKFNDVFLDCGSDEFKAEQIVAGLNKLDEPDHISGLSEHIFANQDGEIEMSKEFLRRLVDFFDDIKNKKYLKER
jgi:hypothetical protein